MAGIASGLAGAILLSQLASAMLFEVKLWPLEKMVSCAAPPR